MAQSRGIVCDANIWIAAINENDSQHKKAFDLLQKLSEKRIFFMIPNYIDLECISMLLVRSNFEKAAKWIDFRNQTSNCRLLHFDEEDHKNIVRLFLQLKNKDLSSIDISLLYLKKHNFEIHTFDEKLKKALNF